MKKIIIGVLLLIASIAANAKEKSAVDKVITTASNAIDSGKKAVSDAVTTADTSSNFRKIYTDVKDGIAALASSLKVGAEHVYSVLVRQQIVYAIVWLIVCIIVVICVTMLMRWTTSMLKPGSSASEDMVAICVIGWLVTLIGMFICIFHLDVMVGGLANPEYGAIKDIIEIVNPKR